MAETLRSTPVSTKSQRIAELASHRPPLRLTTLAHHIDLDWLYEGTRPAKAILLVFP